MISNLAATQVLSNQELKNLCVNNEYSLPDTTFDSRDDKVRELIKVCYFMDSKGREIDLLNIISDQLHEIEKYKYIHAYLCDDILLRDFIELELARTSEEAGEIECEIVKELSNGKNIMLVNG